MDKKLLFRILDEEETRIMSLEIAVETLKADISRERIRLSKIKTYFLKNA